MAHTARRFSPRGNSGSPRRNVSWAGGPQGSFGAISATTVALMGNGTQALFDNLTIVRIRGELLLYITTAGGAADEGFRWSFGMCNVSENAFNAGVASVPAPFTDIAWDGWMVHH